MAIETTPLGFQKPDGNEPVKQGDNVIAANAQTAEQLHAAERARLAQLEGAAGFPGTGLDLSDQAVNPLLDTATTTRGKLDARYANAGSTTTSLAGKVGKGEQVSYAKDFGLVGDGTNEFGKLKTFMESGGILIFEKGKTYSYTPTTTIQIPAGTTILSNGAKLYELVSADGYWFKISDRTTIDTLDVSIAGGTATRGVWLAGNDITIGLLKVVSRDPNNSYTTNRRTAVSIGQNTGDTNAPHKNIHIGTVRIENWQYAIGIYNADGCTIENLEMVSAMQGLYIRDSKRVNILAGYAEGLSTFAKGNPGENSIIMEATTANDSVTDIFISNFRSMVSGEHGYRLGGSYTMRNITFDNCYATQAGSGLGTLVDPDNHGGCGFKILGATPTLNSAATHDNLRFINCTVESLYDSRRTGRDDGNFVGFMVGKASNVHFQNPVVRGKRNATTYADDAYAAWDGIRILGSSNVSINNPHISNCANAGIIFYDQDPTTYNWGGGCTYVNVNGGVLRNNVYGVAVVMLWSEILRNVKINGTQIEGGTHSYWLHASTPATALSGCTAAFTAKGNTVANVAGAVGNLVMDMQGIEVGNSLVADGSTITNTAGQRKHKARGTWFLLNPSGNTASRPTSGISVGQMYYDMSLLKPIWLKAFGTPNVWTDAAGTSV